MSLFKVNYKSYKDGASKKGYRDLEGVFESKDWGGRSKPLVVGKGLELCGRWHTEHFTFNQAQMLILKNYFQLTTSPVVEPKACYRTFFFRS